MMCGTLVLAHRTNHIDNLFGREIGVDPGYVERRMTRAVRLNDEDLSVAAFHAHRAVPPRPLKNRRELLASFGKSKNCHRGISIVFIPASVAAATKP
jgi:hypothetical protein